MVGSTMTNLTLQRLSRWRFVLPALDVRLTAGKLDSGGGQEETVSIWPTWQQTSGHKQPMLAGPLQTAW